ncbi:MAG: hypothetical protein AB1489_36675 [Acidobacteriota bacterium]
MEPATALNRGIAITNTIAEHEVILATQHKLEAILASAASGREQHWLDLVIVELKQLNEQLRKHRDSAESSDGFFNEVSDVKAKEKIASVRAMHEKLITGCEELVDQLRKKTDAMASDIEMARRRAAILMSEIRMHQAIEADIIFEAFARDIGNLD